MPASLLQRDYNNIEEKSCILLSAYNQMKSNMIQHRIAIIPKCHMQAFVYVH